MFSFKQQGPGSSVDDRLGNPDAMLGIPREGRVRERTSRGRLEMVREERRMRPRQWP